jgi:RNA polymerase sigma-70 factor (ECF subfamily)
MPERTSRPSSASKLSEDAVEEAIRPPALPQPGRLQASDEGELVAACADGKPEAFRELLARHRRSALTLAYHMLGSAEDAEDVAQEAFVRVFQAIPQFRRQAAFTTWLYRIVTNLCLGRQRRQRPVVELEALAEPSAPDSPSQQVTEGLVARQVLAQMPPQLRAILVLREQEGLSYQEIAKALSLPLGTVRSRLSKARACFRRLWNELVQGRDG